MSSTSTTIVILAAQRTGVVNPLAEKAGVSHKCLVPICGEPLIVHVMRTVTAFPGVGNIRIVMEPEAHEEVGQVIASLPRTDAKVEFIPSAPNIVESMLAGTADDPGPFIITTADNVLITLDALHQVRQAMQHADAVLCLTTKERVHAAHPEGQRNFYELRDAGYANCNLYGLASREAFSASEIFREGGQFQANPGRMIRAFGLFNILAVRFGWVTLDNAFKRLSKRFGMKARPVVFEDGSLAIDVDNDRTYNCCETIMLQRKAAQGR